jgi:hypothetical protein
MLPSTTERVPAHTDEDINLRMRAEYENRVAQYADEPDEIDARLDALDHEWDIERAIEANAATLALAGLALGATVDRRWLILPTAVAGFLLQHALQGWCPPVPVLRRLGFRTANEIGRERYALKALRGDFVRVDQGTDRASAAIQAVEL